MIVDYERRMRNWALWRTGGAAAFTRTFSAIYDLGPRAPRSGNMMPMLAGEAQDTDDAVRELDHELQRAIVLRYVRQLDGERLRRALRCRRGHEGYMLDLAREQILAFLDRRAKLAARRRAALASGVLLAV